MDMAMQAARTGKLGSMYVSLTLMQGSFGPLRATPEGRLDQHTLATTAATYGHLGIVRHLCREHDVPANAVPADKELSSFFRRHMEGSMKGTYTPLVQAIQNGHEDIALFLLAFPNQDLDLGRQMTSHNSTVLHLAAKQGLERVIKDLVEQHGMDFAAPDGRDMTPLSLASTQTQRFSFSSPILNPGDSKRRSHAAISILTV
jgi:ankyrin repeat protein